MSEEKKVCCDITEDPVSIERERNMLRDEFRKSKSDNEDLKNLIIKILFDRYGFGK